MTAEAIPFERRCVSCAELTGTLHRSWCRLAADGGSYVDADESANFALTTAASTAVNSLLDGGFIPEADPPDPIRRCELAVIWLGEATAELSDAIVAAKDSGRGYPEIAAVLGMTREGVRQRYVRVKAERMANGGFSDASA